MIKLYNMDCMEAMKKMPDNAFDLCITDPPYNVGLQYKTHKDNMPKEEYQAWCRSWFNGLIRLCKCVVITPGMMNLSFWYQLEPYWTIAWIKPNQCSSSRLGGFNAWEPVLLFGKPLKKIGQDLINIPIKMQSGASFHPCPKSLDAWKELLHVVGIDGMSVIDPFLGSGTTAIACHDMGYDLTGYEIDKDYYDAAVKRLENHQKQGQLFL